MSLSKEQILLEYAKCINDTPYALKTYLQTYDNTQSKYVPLELFNDQVTLVKDYDTCEENIALKYRQAGVSTVTSAWASKRLVFAKKRAESRNWPRCANSRPWKGLPGSATRVGPRTASRATRIHTRTRVGMGKLFWCTTV